MRRDNGGDALIVDVQVVPRAPRAAVGPLVGDRLRVAVSAPPVDGAANAAVIDALAAAFGVRRAAVSILRGETGRRKTVRIEGEAARASRPFAAPATRRDPRQRARTSGNSSASASAVALASMMLADTPIVLQRSSPRAASSSTRVLAPVAASGSRMRTL